MIAVFICSHLEWQFRFASYSFNFSNIFEVQSSRVRFYCKR